MRDQAVISNLTALCAWVQQRTCVCIKSKETFFETEPCRKPCLEQILCVKRKFFAFIFEGLRQFLRDLSPLFSSFFATTGKPRISIFHTFQASSLRRLLKSRRRKAVAGITTKFVSHKDLLLHSFGFQGFGFDKNKLGQTTWTKFRRFYKRHRREEDVAYYKWWFHIKTVPQAENR